MRRHFFGSGLFGTALFFAFTAYAPDSRACGCFAPPITGEEFAVNQQAEQIIFEVREEKISAHVRILYQGDPEEFAWLLPLPSVPELELSSTLLFGLVDDQTAPQLSTWVEDRCPEQRYYCRTHECYFGGDDDAAGDDGSDDEGFSVDAGAPSGEGGGFAPPVEVLATERIGAYDTVTFAADEANAAIGWLNDNGFIINETMSPYMQPYLDEGMVFIASKLVPGADLDELRPLRMTYDAPRPSIPLYLTAIAAEPHMMVTSFIYADQEFDPMSLPLATIDASQLLGGERGNYPMLLARAVDEAGGNAFVREFSGSPPGFDPGGTGCCSDDYDVCGVEYDGLCQCPGRDFDLTDCAEQEELVEAVTLLEELRSGYAWFTRLSSRISPDEMTFNPEFEPARSRSGLSGALRLSNAEYSLDRCEDQIVDRERYDELKLSSQCGSLYCDLGECVVTEFGAGCLCDQGAVARVFLDSDGAQSVTCVPDVGTVDFAAGGLDLPSACEGSDVADGSCVDIGGFPAVICDDGKGAVLSAGNALAACSNVLHVTGDKGARNVTREYDELDVCAPPVPSCPAEGWLVERDVDRPGVECGNLPDPSWLEVPPAPDCSEDDATFDDSVFDDAADDDVTDDEDEGSGQGGKPNADAGVVLPPGHEDTTKPRPEPAEDDDDDEDDEDGEPARDDSESDDADGDDADGDDATDDATLPDAGDAQVEPSGKSRLFCSVGSVGQTQGGSTLALLGAFAALLVLRRRR